MKIKKSVYRQMLRSFSPAPPERGGVLGIVDGTVCAYACDEKEDIAVRAAHRAEEDELKCALKKWRRKGITFAGFVHSHPNGQDCLSQGDLRFAERVFGCLPEETACLYFPLIASAMLATGSIRISFFSFADRFVARIAPVPRPAR